jgi:hypothetical protein
MRTGMQRLSWLALVMWLGCGDANSGDASTPQREGVGDGEISGNAAGSAAPSADKGLAASAPSAPSKTSAPTPGAAMGTASGPTSSASAAPPTATTPAGAAPSPSSGAGGSGSAPSTPSSGSEEPSSDSDDGASESEAPPKDAPSLPTTNDGGEASVLTAGTWDDNRNFDRFEKYRKNLADEQLNGMLPSTDEEHADAQKAFAQPAPREKLDVSLVIDTTGSMGDEIRYLQKEFLALSEAIEEKYPNAEQRWSLVLYRDMGDEYVTRWFDFREDAMDFRDKLGAQSAGGGGDFPEAPDAALAAMAELAWRTDDNVARLAFWVADAPHHDDKAEDMLKAIRGARELGVHLYPVASSGVDELTEVTMRSAAQLTGGRYLFLTDDSGVGGAHKEPSIPCYFVTKLDSAILRMVNIEMSGTYAEPAAADIIRTGGDPQDRKCELKSGEVVEAF